MVHVHASWLTSTLHIIGMSVELNYFLLLYFLLDLIYRRKYRHSTTSIGAVPFFGASNLLYLLHLFSL